MEASVQVKAVPLIRHGAAAATAASCTSGGPAVVVQRPPGRAAPGPIAAAPPVCVVSRVPPAPGASGANAGKKHAPTALPYKGRTQ